MDRYPFIFSAEKKHRLRRHFLFWACWWLFQAVLYAFLPGSTETPYIERFPVSAVNAALYLIPHAFLAYSLMYFVIPKLLLKGKYMASVVSVLLLFVATATISSVIGMYVLKYVHRPLVGRVFTYSSSSNSYQMSFFMALLAGLRGAITIGGLAAAIKLSKYWYVKEQRNLQLQKENIEAQMQLLKAQVHPHFLFNTLNNIYSYTQNTAPTGAALVAGLSDMLRYILYEGAKPMVPLRNELKMLEDYVSLEKVRYGNSLDVHLDFPAHTENVFIAPLLLLPLVENCFKHGARHMLEQPWISLRITLDGTDMRLKLVNGKAADYKPANKMTGIGLANVEKRLALLYPQQHALKITDEEELFIVDLHLQLQKDFVAEKNLSPSRSTAVHA